MSDHPKRKYLMCTLCSEETAWIPYGDYSFYHSAGYCILATGIIIQFKEMNTDWYIINKTSRVIKIV